MRKTAQSTAKHTTTMQCTSHRSITYIAGNSRSNIFHSGGCMDIKCNNCTTKSKSFTACNAHHTI